MAVICRAYTSHDEAGRAVGALLAAGIAGGDVRVLMGQREHDVSAEPEGEFAGTTRPEDVVGDFAGAGHERDEGMGTYAGDPATQRAGSFADTDRDIVASYPDGTEHERVTGDRDVKKMLVAA